MHRDYSVQRALGYLFFSEEITHVLYTDGMAFTTNGKELRTLPETQARHLHVKGQETNPGKLQLEFIE